MIQRTILAGAVLALLSAALGSAQSASDRLQSLLADERRSAFQAHGGARVIDIKKIEQEDGASLRRLRDIPREKLTLLDERTLYDLLERDLLSRIEQLRLRLYLTPYLIHPRVATLLGGLVDERG